MLNTLTLCCISDVLERSSSIQICLSCSFCSQIVSDTPGRAQNGPVKLSRSLCLKIWQCGVSSTSHLNRAIMTRNEGKQKRQSVIRGTSAYRESSISTPKPKRHCSRYAINRCSREQLSGPFTTLPNATPPTPNRRADRSNDSWTVHVPDMFFHTSCIVTYVSKLTKGRC